LLKEIRSDGANISLPFLFHPKPVKNAFAENEAILPFKPINDHGHFSN
jgi:hypothetical protein